MRRGCLLFAFPSGGPALPDGARLPALPRSRIHRHDLPAAERAQRAAEGAQGALLRDDVPAAVLTDLGRELAQLLGSVHTLAERLAEARGFLGRNDPDLLARERAEIELKRLEAGAAELLELKRSSAALEERSALADRVRGQIGTLEARLAAAGRELEALRARIESRSDAEELAHEVRAYHRSAVLALEAFEATRRELG